MSSNKLSDVLSLLDEKRIRTSTSGKKGLLIASESDKGRVINSAAFRRLQQKAQVFPLEANASVRTRLTHSIEVSQIGRHLAQKVIEKDNSNQGDYSKLAAFVNTIETACLLHDIGNPPFGHFGESAIRSWFKENDHDYDDLRNFDGNPQGLRLISFLSGHDEYGLNLTCTLLLSCIKYPWHFEKRPDGKKIGIFKSDYEMYSTACENLSWEPNNRFPFVILMDIADEIAYSMSDLEDGLEKNIKCIDDYKSEFGSERFESENIDPFIAFKTSIINDAVNEAANTFFDNLDKIMDGHDVELLDNDGEIYPLLKKIKQYARENIYSHHSAEQVELAGFSVIKGILKHFGELLSLKSEKFSALLNQDKKLIKKHELDYHIRLLRRLPKSYINKYKIESRGSEDVRRAHLIVDTIASMTDDYALETYQVLEGIRIK